MKDPKDWFIDRCSFFEKEDIQQISRLIRWLDDEEKKNRESTTLAAQYSAMLADICEILFGDLANGSPFFMSSAHAGWACSPSDKRENETYLSAMMRHYFKNDLSEEVKKNIEQWNQFLKTFSDKFKE